MVGLLHLPHLLLRRRSVSHREGLLLITGIRMILPWRYLSILTSGLMEVGKIFPLLGASKLLALAFTFLLLKLLLITRFVARLKSMAMLGLSVAAGLLALPSGY